LHETIYFLKKNELWYIIIKYRLNNIVLFSINNIFLKNFDQIINDFEIKNTINIFWQVQRRIMQVQKNMFCDILTLNYLVWSLVKINLLKNVTIFLLLCHSDMVLFCRRKRKKKKLKKLFYSHGIRNLCHLTLWPKYKESEVLCGLCLDGMIKWICPCFAVLQCFLIAIHNYFVLIWWELSWCHFLSPVLW
jgi:hypothetical protein